MKFSSRCCWMRCLRYAFAALVIVMMPRDACAYPVPSANCDMKTVPVDPVTEVVEREWCEVTEQAPSIQSYGEIRDRAGSTDTCDGCAPNCDNPELPQPVGKTCTTLLSVKFTDTKERSTTGVVGGDAGGLFAGIEASLEVKIGYKKDNTIKIDRSVSTTIAPCTWQTEQIFMRVLQGKKMSVSVRVSACKQIRDKRLNLVYEHYGVARTSTITLNCNLGMNGDSVIRTIANGRCPRP